MAPRKKRKILIVDDDEAFADSNRLLLEAEGYEVVVAHNGTDGLKLAVAERPDLMILDVMMATKTEGFEVSRKIPDTPELRGMPVLLVTGIVKDMHLPFRFEPDASWLPVDSIIDKPVAPPELLAHIKRKLG